MTDFITPLLQWLNDHPSLAGLVIFLISAGESVAILGTIVPGSVMMTAIGAIAGAGVINLWSAVLWAILGAIVGDGISYWVGHYYKDRLHYVWPFKSRPQMLKRGEAFFEKYGGMSVFIGRFIGPVRALVPLVAGMLGMKPVKFYIANITSAILWAPAYMLPGIILGAASLELPPDIAVHALLKVVLVSLFIILCVWLGYKLLVMINVYIVSFLNYTWSKLEQSPYSYPLTVLFRHHTNKTHGQLILVFYLLIACLLFTYLAHYILHHPASGLVINDSLFHFFRSIRTPQLDSLMLTFTCLGDKLVLFPLILTLGGLFIYKKQWRIAFHIVMGGCLIGLGSTFFKFYIQSIRPWGISLSPTGYSFPSGHVSFATTFFIGLGLLLSPNLQKLPRKLMWLLIATIIILISLSRVYLGAHWFTDVMGGWLLAAIVIMLTILSYNRKMESIPLQPVGIFYTALVTLLISFSIYYSLYVHKLSNSYSQLEWPHYTVDLSSWWEQKGVHLPFFRINRFGLSDEILNIQWVEDISTIKNLLLQNGWEVPAKLDWIDVLHRLSDVQSTEHLPLVSPIYYDKNPSLVLIKQVKNKKFIALRLWKSQIYLNDSQYPLWVGVVNEIPRTYSWIFKHSRIKQVSIAPALVFTKPLVNYDIKQLTVKASHNKNQTMILIKPKTEH